VIGSRGKLAQETRPVTLDPVGRFGAGTQLLVRVKWPWSRVQFDAAPGWKTLFASNKKSEHNIHNVLPRIVVYQSPPMTQSTDFRRRISFRPTLRPGNSSLGRT